MPSCHGTCRHNVARLPAVSAGLMRWPTTVLPSGSRSAAALPASQLGRRMTPCRRILEIGDDDLAFAQGDAEVRLPRLSIAPMASACFCATGGAPSLTGREEFVSPGVSSTAQFHRAATAASYKLCRAAAGLRSSQRRLGAANRRSTRERYVGPPSAMPDHCKLPAVLRLMYEEVAVSRHPARTSLVRVESAPRSP